MRRFFTASLATLLLAGLLTLPVWGKTHQFKLSRSATLAGVSLEAGVYKLKFSPNPGHEATVFQNGEELLTTGIEIRPRQSTEIPNSVYVNSKGVLKEIRLKKQVIVFQP